MSTQRLLAGLVVGIVAILVGAGSATVAIITRRRRDRISATYASSGGIVYSIVQFGCAGLLVVAGILMILLAVTTSR